MRTLIYVFILSLSITSLAAQKNFEGTIVYATYFADFNHSSPIINTIYFKGGKILVNYAAFPKRNILYDFEKGKKYEFKEDSIVVISEIEKSSFNFFTDTTAIKDSILKIKDYTCTKKSTNITSSKNENYKSVEVWFPTDLIFKINTKATQISPPLIYFDNLSPSLKAIVKFNGKNSLDEPINYLRIEATEIIPMALNDSIFVIPAHLKIVGEKEYYRTLIQEFKRQIKNRK